MSQAARPVVRPEEVSSVLKGGAKAPAAAGPTPYSLREPLAIPPDAEPLARRQMEALAAVTQEALLKDLGEGATVELEGFRQQRAGAVLAALPAPAWVLPFSGGPGGGMALALHPGVGLALVELAMGGAGEVGETARPPTSLESRVMGRLVRSLAPPLGRALGATLEPVAVTSGELPESVAAAGETLGVGLLKITMAKGSGAALLLASAGLLPPKARPLAAASTAKPGRVGPLAARLDQVRLEARPVLEAGRVSLSDIAALKPGAVLRLEQPEDALLDLRVEGQRIFSGRIVRQAGGTAFSVTWRRGRSGPGRGE
ncbi:MAG TPA: FliM/FliN family flagellar motor switch protein [Candidatus Polarisedimenticolia bacterium]|nr:FliM/FliN family flagellar motor switch protein [Candidatus Polarisedimenticolia bacterium]